MTFIPAAQEDLAGLLNREVWERVRLLAPTPARPVLSASLILIDGSGAQPRVLMGKRHPGDRFMPDKFVFPGGCVAPHDKRMNVAGMLPELVEMRLAKVGPAYSLPRALALAAIRETCEETGLMIAERDCGEPENPPGSWRDFAAHGYPDLEPLHFIARATTPPRLPRRYDTVFLAADSSAVTHKVEGMVGPDRELVETAWVTLKEAFDLELAVITRVVLYELEKRLAAGMSHFLPAPWYRVGRQGWVRQEM